MKKSALILIALLLLTSFAFAEFSGDLTVGVFNKIDRTSLGVSGIVFPQKYQWNRFSLGMDFGIQLVERYLYGNIQYPLDTLTDGRYKFTYDKVYRDYMFIPFGFVARYDLRDPERLNIIKPSLSLGIGGVLNIYQQSYRRVYNYYVVYPTVLDYRYVVDIGGESLSTFDYYIRPAISVSWNRIYLSYEYYFNTDYLLYNISVGYVFRL